METFGVERFIRKSVRTGLMRLFHPDEGEIVSTPFGPARIASVRRMALESIRDMFWREEGVESPAAFEEVWARIHPRAGFRPEERVYLIRFELLPDAKVGSPRA